MAKDTTKTTKAEADVAAKLLSPDGKPDGPGAPGEAESQKVGKVEARIAALEGYVKANVKALGWPKFEG